MGVAYRGHIFVGCKINDSYFYDAGSESVYQCDYHGTQSGTFCSTCGTRCHVEPQKIWRAPMLVAADAAEKTPDQLWQIWDPDGGFASQTDKGVFGRWKFGYDNDRVLWGTVVASHWDNDDSGDWLSLPELEAAVTAVNAELSKMGAPDYAAIHCIIDA